MPSTAEILRKACKANGLGASGSATQLLARLFNASTKTTKATIRKDKSKSKKKQNMSKSKSTNVRKPKTQVPLKAVKNGKGMRLSASYYFHTVCNGKITRCEPRMITQPNGQKRLKKIRIVNGAHGKHPRWVNVDED